MDKSRSFPVEAALLTAVAALLCLGLFAAPAERCANAEVLVSGSLLIPDRSYDGLLLVVEVDGEYCRPARLDRRGRFQASIPAGSSARLHFMKPGHLPKEVVVDTRDMAGSDPCSYAPRKVSFDVRLEREERALGKAYDGPVGTVAFTKGSNLSRVRHHKRYAALRSEDDASTP